MQAERRTHVAQREALERQQRADKAEGVPLPVAGRRSPPDAVSSQMPDARLQARARVFAEAVLKLREQNRGLREQLEQLELAAS